MDIVLRNAKIVDSGGKYHQKQADILIKNGKIEKIAKSIKVSGIKEIIDDDLHVSVGWVDLCANYQDPGYEHKETIESGLKSSAAGGFTKVCVLPNTFPTRDSKSQLEYLINQSKNSIVDCFPYGALSKDCLGKDIAELNDMHQNGAIAFTDGKQYIDNPNLLYRALLYSKAFNGLIVHSTAKAPLNSDGVMNEGTVSTQLGLKGIPEVAEVIAVNRDIYLLEYAKGKLHFNTISTSDSLAMIKEAKMKGLKLSCDIASYNLLLTDEELAGFDSRFKTLPPLRNRNTVSKLIKYIKDGTVDAICSDHTPQDIESKKKEFDHAAFGMINAQTSFAVTNTALSKQIDLSRIIELFTRGPERILNIANTQIEEGELACLTLFAPNTNFTFKKDQVLSKSSNSAFFGRELKGKVIGIINNNRSFLN